MDYMQENSLSTFLTPKQAWDELQTYKSNYYRKYAAAYGGERAELAATAESGTFWKRNGKCRIHVPIAADIAATSSDLLFSEEPRFTCFDEETEDSDSKNQQRLDELIAANNVHGLLNEAAETNAALGDVYLKLNSRPDEVDHPILTITQGDCAWPEYVLGVLKCIHFFDELKRDSQKNIVWRIYERYERGKIVMAIFKGSSSDLGTEDATGMLEQLGYEPEMTTPIDDMMAVHVPNIKPNRAYRSSVHGRSDYDGLRDMMDSLDETYSSWMRDIRLANAAGFLNGLDPDFLSIVGEVDVVTARNNVFNVDGNKGGTYTLRDKFFLASRVELGYGPESGISEGSVFALYDGATNTDRIKYDITAETTARYWWMRSPYPSYAYSVRFVYPDGSLLHYSAGSGYGAAAACVIY